MIGISRIIAELDKSIGILEILRRKLLTGQQNEVAMEQMKRGDKQSILDAITEDQMRRDEHQANQHGDNPMGKDGEAR